MYRAYGLLLPDSDFTLSEAAVRLAAKFPRASIAPGDQGLTLTLEDWDIRLRLREGPEVLEEARAMAEQIGGAEDELGITNCARRVEVWSDVPDREMEHFNDYLLVMEAVQSFRGVIGVDPQEPSLL